MAPKNQSMMDWFIGGRHKDVTLSKRLPPTAREYAEAKLKEIAMKEAAIHVKFLDGSWKAIPLGVRQLGKRKFYPGETEIRTDKAGNLVKDPRVNIHKFHEQMWKTDPITTAKSLDYTLAHEVAHIRQVTRGGFNKSKRQVPWRRRREEIEANEYAKEKTGMDYEEYTKITEDVFLRTRMRQIKEPRVK